MALPQLNLLYIYRASYKAIARVILKSFNSKNTSFLEEALHPIGAELFKLYRFSTKPPSESFAVTVVDLFEDQGLYLRDGSLGDVDSIVTVDTTSVTGHQPFWSTNVIVGVDFSEPVSDAVVHKLALVFTHELVHMVQHAKIPPKRRAFIIDQGKRFFNTKTMNINPELALGLDYLALFFEIDAHATSATLELLTHPQVLLLEPEYKFRQVKALLRHYFRTPTDIPIGSSLYSYYFALNRYNPGQLIITKAWHLFCKKVYHYVAVSCS